MSCICFVLKTWPEPFEAIWRGDKRYEIRKDDRGFGVRDQLNLREFVPHEPCKGSGVIRYPIASGVVTEALPDGSIRVDGVRQLPNAVCDCSEPHGCYTGREVWTQVTYMTKGGQWGLPPNLCVLGFKRVRKVKKRPSP